MKILRLRTPNIALTTSSIADALAAQHPNRTAWTVHSQNKSERPKETVGDSGQSATLLNACNLPRTLANRELSALFDQQQEIACDNTGLVNLGFSHAKMIEVGT
jgi:hypothetical protein